MAHLWREYPTFPFTRWACEIEEDLTLPAGYRVVNSDSLVFNPTFALALHESFKRPLQIVGGGIDGDKSVSSMHAVYPGDPLYYAAAIRQVPQAVLGGPRS